VWAGTEAIGTIEKQGGQNAGWHALDHYRRQRSPSKGGKQVKVTIENGELVIRLPVNKPPVLSGGGKTLIVATTGGNEKTDVVVDGQRVVVGATAYIKKPAR
jgi:hypothetical protein